MFARVEVAIRPEFPDPAAGVLLRKIELAHLSIYRQIRWARYLDVYWLEIDAPRDRVKAAIHEVFKDPVENWLFTGDLIPSAAGSHGGAQDLTDHAPFRWGEFWGLEKRFRSGVTDTKARSTQEAFQIVLGTDLKSIRAATGSLFLIDAPGVREEDLSLVSRDVFCNELIESWNLVTREEIKGLDRFHPEQVKLDLPHSTSVKPRSSQNRSGYQSVVLEESSDEDLLEMSEDRLWALNLQEMRAIRDYFSESRRKEVRQGKGLSHPTDVELEMIAQTWSEHCKHKIFGANVSYTSSSPDENIPEKISGLFKETIVRTTSELDRDWLISVFKDNAGIIRFDEEDAVCIKVETHNSPSALDPYGGSLTGIVGVNRDILGCGRGARPIFNTNVFCLAPPTYSQNLPDRILHPRRILDGVRRGVEHGGNKSGIPTVNGALLFDDRYLGKPLIYCGTGGIMPRESAGLPCESKEIQVGDRVCMVGGRIGKDGIHGATFSSLALVESSPVSAVQLGDPITQKRMADFLLEARDKGLFRTLTDNGAGGLSSSVGELAEVTNGARIDLARAQTKYPGLKPFELLISESQERMTVAVPPEKMEAFSRLAGRRSVEVSDLGEFNDSGSFDVFYNGEIVASMELEFLHEGLPVLELTGTWKGPPRPPKTVEVSFEREGSVRLLELLGRPNIASKEWLIRQYDHEVQGTSVVKPLHTVQPGTAEASSGPNDGAVVRPKPESWQGLAVGCGVHPKFSDVDPYLMAQASVDEAVRNILSVGSSYGSPDDEMALTDNFCWPDPVGSEEKTGWLVRACYGLREACLQLRVPLVSGKDSMKNDYRGQRDGKPLTISVPPTLLVTAIGKVKDVRHARTSDFKNPGDQIYLLGGASIGLNGSELHALFNERLQEKGGSAAQVVLPVAQLSSEGTVRTPRPDWELARRIYGWLGGTIGQKQNLLTSVHDVSEGGLLVAVAEGLFGPRLGAKIDVSTSEDNGVSAHLEPWEFFFGEAFHSFVVSVSGGDSKIVEAEWNQASIPFVRIGEVQSQPELEVGWRDHGQARSWVLSLQNLLKAWNKEGYWE